MQDFTQIATHVLPARHPSDTGKQLPRWQLEVLSPTRESFKDFADPALSHLQRHPVIRNDYLAEQHQKYLALGWPSGRGPHSGQTIFQANTLVLRLTFMYPPAVPGVRLLVKVLGTLGAKREDLVGQAWRQGLMATVLETESMMQSNLIAWDRQARMAPPGTVTRKQVWERPLDAPQPLISLQRPLPFNSQKIRLQGRVPATVDPTPVRPTRAETTGQPTPVQAKKNEPTESELCGVLLCCIERD
jgi:hypothetical protein